MKNHKKKDSLRVSVSEEKGVRYLHFGTEWVQGAMRVRKPWALELEYSRNMMAWLLFLETAPQVVQIGLGAASLTKFVYKYLPGSSITAVDNSHLVLAAARSQFGLPGDDDRLTVLIEDGEEYIRQPARRKSVSVLQVDVFDQHARGPVLESVAFYSACAAALTPDGVMAVNLFGEVPSYERNYRTLRESFDGRVLLLPPLDEGNVIALAFAAPARADGAPLTTWGRLRNRADCIQADYGLDAHRWVDGLEISAGRSLGDATIIGD